MERKIGEIGFSRKYCIPYEGNEHLLDTRNNPE